MPAEIHQPPTDAPSPAAASDRVTGKARRQRRRTKHRDESEIGVLNLAEQAFHLLRTTPLANLWLYYLGAIPFVVGAFFFWADMSRSSYASRDAAFLALAVTGLYLWMKFWQGKFCRRLWEQLHPSGDQVRLSPGRQLRHAAAQVFLHAFSLPALLISTIFSGWVVAFFQNASVLAFTRDYGRPVLRRTIRDSGTLAQQNWLQNYLVLGLTLVLCLFIWANVLGASVVVPMMLKSFLGIETVFTLSPESSIFNTTFLFGTLLLTFLIVDPLLKAIYTLRCFRGLARQTGADLLARLDRIEAQANPATGSRRASRAVLVAILATALFPSPLNAQDEPSPKPDELAQSIERTLQDKAYQWRLPRQELEATTEESESWLSQAMKNLAESVEKAFKAIGDLIDKLLRKLFERRGSERAAPSLGGGAAIGQVAEILFIALIVALVAWIVFLLVNKSRKEKAPELGLTEAEGPIDLESDAIVATQLPEDEWMRLAREQIEKGEYRLAVRALFLASLANLGDRGLLKVARFKSNRDYSRELRLKARSLPELQAAFQENVGLFERVWYGLHSIGREAVERFTSNYERITLDPATAARE
ncbi:MAG: DUF4129 domain-containing protein [Verrucomicrobiae bacterium]|nr:DUF4129 domain-containing protein [Verrucomicrobiae bacterium]